MIAIRGPGSEKWRFEICRRAPGASILQKIGKGHREPPPVVCVQGAVAVEATIPVASNTVGRRRFQGCHNKRSERLCFLRRKRI